MTLLSPKRNFSMDIDFISTISSKLDKKLSQAKCPSEVNLDKLSAEELQDLDKIVGIADFLLHKHSENKEMQSILKYFVSVISDTATSLNGLDDEVSELILSAEDSINKVKEMHTNISDRSDFKKNFNDGPEYTAAETGAINLTKSVIEINTTGYQQNSQGDIA
ncbi:hypothetical protein [Nitrosopumilus sp.]|uniref:hypothetical protein n=1 Tax=Nitrosopumilus sp. TaxID=2024843 RepID=UPI003B5BE548